MLLIQKGYFVVENSVTKLSLKTCIWKTDVFLKGLIFKVLLLLLVSLFVSGIAMELQI